MTPRHPSMPPRLWLMTDERMGDALWHALGRLPRGSGVVFRHYRTPLAERRRLFARIARIARRRDLVLIRAGEARLGRGERGVHGQRGAGLITWPVHHRREAIAGVRAGAGSLGTQSLQPAVSLPGVSPNVQS